MFRCVILLAMLYLNSFVSSVVVCVVQATRLTMALWTRTAMLQSEGMFDSFAIELSCDCGLRSFKYCLH